MSDRSTSLLLCKCRRCGPGGCLLDLEQHSFHAKTQRLESTLLSDPWNTQFPTSQTASAEPAAHTPESLSSAGRRMVMGVFQGLEDLDKYRDKLRTLRECVFDPSQLRFVPDLRASNGRSTPALQLDPSERCNQAYLSHLSVLQGIGSSVNHIGSSNPHLRSSITALKDEIDHDIGIHEAILQEAKNSVVARRNRYRDKGSNAESFDPSTSSFLHLNSLVLAFMILSALLRSILGTSISATKLVMKCVRFIVKLAFLLGRRSGLNESDSQASETLDEILRHLSYDPRTASSRYKLSPAVIMYASCPRCSKIYEPFQEPNELGMLYQDRCSAFDLLGRPCNAKLMRCRLVGNRREWRAIRRYPFRDPSTFIVDLFSRPGLEETMDSRRADVRDPCEDIWDAELLSNFTGPDHFPFFSREGHLAFALAIDWFNPYKNMEAKKKWSIGAVYMVCLNLAPEVRYKIENVCLVAIIPGPKEPAMEAVNWFLEPIAKSFAKLWNPGLWIKRTQKFPYGRLVRAIIAILVADLMGARHVGGLTFPSHKFFCSYCKLTLLHIDNLDKEHWPKRTLREHQEWSQRWNEATTEEQRDHIADVSGIRWSAFNILAYWNPLIQLGPDGMHMLLAVLANLSREGWHMNINLEAGDGTYDPFHKPPNAITMAQAEHHVKTLSRSGLKKRLKKPVLVELCIRRNIRTGGKAMPRLLDELHAWRVAEGIIFEDGSLKPGQKDIAYVPPSAEEMSRWLTFETDAAKLEAAEDHIFHSDANKKKMLKTVLLPTFRALCRKRGIDPTGTKAQMLERLLAHGPKEVVGAPNPDLPQNLTGAPSLTIAHTAFPNGTQTLEPTAALLLSNPHPLVASPASRHFPVMGYKLLKEVRHDIFRTITPDWYKRAPENLGDPKQGKLSAKEWRSTFTASFLITLVRVWGFDYDVEKGRSGRHEILDNYLHLAIAVLLATQGVMSEWIVALYEHHMRQYLEGYQTLYPTQSILPYHHISLHYPEFLRLLGPWDSHSSPAYETFNGMCQSVNTNQIFGDLEVTIMDTFSSASHLKGAVFENLPEDLHPLRDIVSDHLSCSGMGGLSRDTTGQSYREGYRPIHSEGDEGIVLRPDVQLALNTASPEEPPGPKQIVCATLMRSNMKFSVCTKSSRDSQISYKGVSGDIRFGRIHTILYDPRAKSSADTHLLVERYEPLSGGDMARDIYRHHPLIGTDGYQLAEILYDRFQHEIEVITTGRIIGHIARCTLETGGDLGFKEAVFVAVQLDRNFIFNNISPRIVDTMRGWKHNAYRSGASPSELRAAAAEKAPKRKRYDVQDTSLVQSRNDPGPDESAAKRRR